MTITFDQPSSLDQNPQQTEQERMDQALDSIDLKIVLANARRISKRNYQLSPNWVLAMDIFGLGSTYAFGLCRRFGIDPESRSLAPSPKPSISGEKL